MSSSYRRIESNSIKMGQSFVFTEDNQNDVVSNLEVQKRMLQKDIEKAQNDLLELKNSLKALFEQKDNIIADGKKEAEDIKAKAILQAEEIISNANAGKDEIIEEAKVQGHKQGFEAGFNDGLEKFQNDFQKQITSLGVLANAAFEVKNEIVYSAETDILELALLIAQKVVQVEFEENKDCFKNMVQTAISLLKEKENVKIVVNPKLFEYANEISPDLVEKIESLEQIKVIQDKTVSDDGAVVESLESRIDARISTQLETLARTLLIDNRGQAKTSEEIEEKIAQKLKNADD